MKNELNIGRILKLAGAYIAFVIGSGFATGQEIIQFYTSYGSFSFIAIMVSLLLFSWFGATMLDLGYKQKDIPDEQAYRIVCGSTLGTFFQYFVPAFLFCVVVIMIAGAGATLNEYYGINVWIGTAVMAALIYVAYIFGLKSLIDVIGAIGPVIILFTIIVGVYTVVSGGFDLSASTKMMADMEIAQAAPHWLLSGLLYVAYNTFGAFIFLKALGRSAKSNKEAKLGGALGGILLMSATLIMNVAFLSRISEVGNLSIPTLYLAGEMSPVIGVIFSIVLILGIFSTAAPMFWTVCNTFVKEGTPKAKLVALVIIVAAFFGGQLSFSKLVGTIYPYTGYLGILMICALILYKFKNKE